MKKRPGFLLFWFIQILVQSGPDNIAACFVALLRGLFDLSIGFPIQSVSP